MCREAIPDCAVHIIRNDRLTLAELLAYLPYFSAVVVGPGPGSPANPADVGVVSSLWDMPDDALLPVFGVCLGLQSLALAHGAALKRLHVVKHGLISKVDHIGKDLFQGVGPAHVVRYHSLHVELENDGPVEALAYAEDGKENGRVLMAARHCTKPFWGVQYHPESVRTHGGGPEVLQNFWRMARQWNGERKRQQLLWTSSEELSLGPAWPSQRPHSPPTSPFTPLPTVQTIVLDQIPFSVTDICEVLGAMDESTTFVLLDSAAAPGRFSIVGGLTRSSIRVTHCIGSAHVSILRDEEWHQEQLGSRDVWSWMASFMRHRRFGNGHPDIPFWGGLVGYLSYELGVHGLEIPLLHRIQGQTNKRHPDVNLVFVERSVVFDRQTGKVYVQSLQADDPWVSDTAASLRKAPNPAPSTTPFVMQAPDVELPEKELYISRIQSAQAHLATGDSYELCLTAPTRIRTPHLPAWSLYKSARAKNPAPYGAFFRLSPSTFISTSPERFLSYSRGPRTRCELRPIKGTLRKSPGVGRAEVEQALAGNPKEVAENLMIVDLIRHDLHGVLGEDVHVTQFCGIEEYKTVWQMVSVIEGRLPEGCPDEEEREIGWEVLRRSLPPGVHFPLSEFQHKTYKEQGA